MMNYRSTLPALLITAGFAVALGAQGPARELTARELFYTASAAPAPAAKPGPAAGPRTGVRRTARPAAAAAKAPVKEEIPQAQAAARPAPAPAALPAGAQVVPAAMRAPVPASGTALGLKYSILKKDGDNMVEVPPDTVFRAGDRIQFSVQPNGPGYLYIVSQGSSGAWKPMFPSPDVASGDNHVDGWRSYAMPPGSRMVFDEQTGTERVFIVFSREPEPDLENLIYSLQATPKPAAAPTEPARPSARVMMASLNIDDTLVGRLRSAYARDLVIEKVDPATPGERKEYAVYVVNPTGSAASRVVADLKLEHR